MTIHRSKGLQFPVVFVGDTARKFNASDIRQPVLVHRSYGAGLRLRPENGEGAYKTAAYTALANVHARELRSEQMRLLYVALTRAQDKLILTVPLSSGKSAKPFAKAAAFLAAGAGATLHQQANSFADWLRAALLVHPDGGVLRQLSGNRELLFVQTESVMAIRVCDDAVQLAEEPDADTENEVPETDLALVEKLRQGFAWQYPAAALAQVPAKVSVTSIVHKAEQTTLERPGFLSKDGLTAAEMGTALHAFLEHADFAQLAAAKAAGTLDEAIPAERDRQVALQLTPRRSRKSWTRCASAALWKAKPLQRSAPPSRCCGSCPLSPHCPLVRCWRRKDTRHCPLPQTRRCWCRVSPTLCLCTRIIWNCWTTRPTAARPRATFCAPTAPS